MAYTEVTVTGYSASTPSDDGARATTNQISWARIKTGLYDPLKSAIETIDDNVASATAAAEGSVGSVTTLQANVAALSTSLNAPSTTASIFQQTAAPTGWTKGTNLDDYALRLVTGTASTGGSTVFSSVFTARTITTSNLPAHLHSFSASSQSLVFSGTTSFRSNITSSTFSSTAGGTKDSILTSVSDNTSNAAPATFSFSVTSGSAGGASTWDFAVQYVDCIYATKN